MHIFEHQQELKAFLSSNQQSIGFVPTMGALHNGHLSLIERAKEENHLVVASIFINPTQFNDPNDLERYPIEHESDLKKLENSGCDVVYLPKSKEDVYQNEQKFDVDLGFIGETMEALNRPGHFDGVMRVVKLLLEIVSPTRAYFGLKDYQQYLVLSKMVNALNLPTEIIGCDIVREQHGLAMSSRNELLTSEQRENAAVIYLTLCALKTDYENNRILPIDTYLDLITPFGEIEYFELRDASTLEMIAEGRKENIRAFIVVQFGDVRLIDNMTIS